MSLLSVRQESPKYVKAKLTLIGVRSDSRLHALCSTRGYNVKLEGELKSERRRSSEVEFYGPWITKEIKSEATMIFTTDLYTSTYRSSHRTVRRRVSVLEIS